jgi:biopolymer transport protein ExbD
MRRIEQPQVEMQIAPLIDVCFLLLFFYILTSKPDPSEGTLPTSLPGTAALEERLEIPDEQRITVLANRSVLINEQPVDSATNPDLTQLCTILSRLNEAARAHKSTPLVTVEVADNLPHQRLLEVLSACTRAGIRSVSFATTPEEAQ